MLCLFSCAGSHHTARQTGWIKVPRPQRETTIQIRSSEEGEEYWTQYTIIQYSSDMYCTAQGNTFLRQTHQLCHPNL